MATEPIILNSWNLGMGDSPHVGLGVMRNVDIESFPGAVKAGKSPTSLFPSLSGTFTANAGTDVCTFENANVTGTGTAVTVSSTGTLPAGLSASTTYFLIKVSDSTFKLATTLANANAGTAIDITDTGTGTHTVSAITPGTVNHVVKNTRTGGRFFHDSNGRVWFIEANGTFAFLLPGNTLTDAPGLGLAILVTSDVSATYLFALRDGAIDVVNVFGTAQLEAPTWSNSWKTLTNTTIGASRQTVLGQDAIIYFCKNRFVGSIKEVAGQVFAPGNSATYSFNEEALDMPFGEVINWLEELGIYLMSGGDTYNKIYLWDRLSSSFIAPLLVPERSIKRLKNVGNVVYILAGSKGNVYSTQGAYVTHVKKLPDHVVNNSATLIASPVTWGGIADRNGALLFGVGGQTTANDGAWLLYPDGRLIIDNQPSTGAGRVTAFSTESDDFYFMGYASGADYMSLNRRTSFSCVVDSPMYRVATKVGKGTYSQLEVVLAKPASSGSVRVGYRLDSSSSYTTIDTFTADGSTVTFQNQSVGLIDVENIQLQISFDNEVEIVEVRLLP